MNRATGTGSVALFALAELDEGVCLRCDIPGASLIATRDSDGIVHVYHNRCPHRGTELDWLPGRFLDPSGKYLQCATHGALFGIADGNCVSGPCEGSRLARADVLIRDGLVYARQTRDGP